MPNFNSKFLTILLNASGVAVPGQKCAICVNILKYYLLYAFILQTSAQVALLGRPTTLVELSINIVFINCGLFLNSTTMVLHIRKKYMINIFESVNVDFIQPSNAIFGIAASDAKFKKFFFSTGLPSICLYVFSISGTVLLFPFSDKTYDDINALLVPGAFPWPIDSMSKYVFTIALEFSWLSVLSTPVFLNFMFGIYYIFEVRTQYEILLNLIQKFNNSNVWISMANKFDSEMEYEILKSFKYCIQYHQNVLKFTRNFNACYNTIFKMNLIFSVPNIALVLLTIAEEKNSTTIARNVMTLIIIVILLSLYTSIGQVLQNANERFRNALFDIQWYNNKSRKFKTIYLIVLSNTQHVRGLRASSRYIASCELLCDVIKMSYSFYNVIDKAFGH